MNTGVRIAGAFALLAGCVAAPPPLGIVPAETGIDVPGSTLEIGFGRAAPGAVDAVSRLIGSDPLQSVGPPGCRVVRWRDGFELHARNGAFTGWRDARARTGAAAAGDICPVPERITARP